MKLKQVSLPVGVMLLAIAILIDKYLPQSNLLDFIQGLCTGLSIVLNCYYIFSLARQKQVS